MENNNIKMDAEATTVDIKEKWLFREKKYLINKDLLEP